MSHSSENCFGKRSNQNSINKGLGGYIGNRADAINHYKKSEKKRNKELIALKKQNKSIFIIANNSVSYRELKNTKNIKSKASKNRCYYICDSSSSEFYYYSYLSSDNDIEEIIQPTECK